jgi:hypothetical protein
LRNKEIREKIMEKQNCWEFKQCGREPKGNKVAELGICPAAVDITSDGLNGGKNGGRICWAITGTLCGGKVQGTFAQKIISCMACDFFKKVNREEADKFMMLKPGQKYKDVGDRQR